MVARVGLGSTINEVVLTGCSAGGMACYLHCDAVARRLAPVSVRCVCDAGLFLDAPSAVGAGNLMARRFYDVAEKMEARAGLSEACVAAEADWRSCFFAAASLRYTRTPTFVVQSLYNFGAWEILEQGFNPSNGATVAADWRACWSYGRLTPSTWNASCNATQRTIILDFGQRVRAALAPAAEPSNPHGVFGDACPNEHCQLHMPAWHVAFVDGQPLGRAVERWYFENATTKLTDGDFPGNPRCGAYDEVTASSSMLWVPVVPMDGDGARARG
eukprot:118363-Prymnesium_polylepis.1